jgi:hypothetical protein
MDVSKEELRELIREVIDANVCCQFNGCEAGYCHPRLINIEERLEVLIDGVSRHTNWIVAHLKREPQK